MRRTDWDCYCGNNPNNYARRVLKECRINAPPIDEYVVADYLGATIAPITQDQIDDFIFENRNVSGLPDFIRNLKESCAWLEKYPDGKSIIHVLHDSNEQRMRLSVFHEYGHEILPWHDQLNYLCDDSHVQNHGILIPFEREAFRCGTELMMPSDLFFEDAMSNETSIETIKRLAYRYNASLEATAIRYCSILKRYCAMMVVVPSGNDSEVEIKASFQRGDSHLFQSCDYPSSPIIQANQSPLMAKYFVSSSKTMGYASKGTCIGEDNPIFNTWISGKQFKGQIKSSVWGSSKNIPYNAECLRLGKTGMVLVLLWLPEDQLWLGF